VYTEQTSVFFCCCVFHPAGTDLFFFSFFVVYTNSLLASLNARSSLRNYNDDNAMMSMPTDSMMFPKKHLASVLASKENIISDDDGPPT